MIGNVALDVVIGLVFIYLLYSLYATIIMEIVSSTFGLRGRNLRYAIGRMLMDEKKYRSHVTELLSRILASILQVTGRTSNLTYPTLVKKFYNQPSIKYLSSGGIHTTPSYISPESFSKGIIDAIRIDDPEISLLASIEEGLQRFQLSDETKRHIELLLIAAHDDLEKFKISIELWYSDTIGRAMSTETKKQILFLADQCKNDSQKFKSELSKWYEKIETFALGEETKKQLQSMLDEANNDVVKFRILVEQWYNNTMERSIGWFKRSTQIILLFISSVIVIAFNVDTIAIIQKLSTDKEARERLANMASEFVEKNEPLIISLKNQQNDDASYIVLKERLDSLQEIRKYLDEDITTSQNIIASNWNLPDAIVYSDSVITKIPKDHRMIKYPLAQQGIAYMAIHKSIDPQIFVMSISKMTNKKAFEVNTYSYKFRYIFSNGRLWGYLLTILALSIGAPFWFDLLNKLVKLRTSKAIPTDAGGGTAPTNDNSKSVILNRAG